METIGKSLPYIWDAAAVVMLLANLKPSIAERYGLRLRKWYEPLLIVLIAVYLHLLVAPAIQSQPRNIREIETRESDTSGH